MIFILTIGALNVNMVSFLDGDAYGDSMSNLASYSMIFIRAICINYAAGNDSRIDICWRKQVEE